MPSEALLSCYTKGMIPVRQAGMWLKRWWNSTDAIDKLFIGILIVLAGRPLTDVDFGWHLRSGMDLLRTWHIPQLDPYSYTLPDYPWVNHEWLSDGIVAFIYQHLGTGVLIMFFAIIVVAAAWLAVSAWSTASRKSKFISSALIILAALWYWGVRVQMVTVLGAGLVMWSFVQYRNGRLKQLWWYVPLFWLWANLHGGFLVGLGLLAIMVGAEGIKLLINRYRLAHRQRQLAEPALRPDQFWQLVVIGIASSFVTLFNPYGWHLYYDFYKLFTTPLALSSLTEWQPIQFSGFFLIYLIVLLVALLWTYRKAEPTRWAVMLILFALTIWSRRNLPFFLLASAGFIAEAIDISVRRISDYLVRRRWLVAGLAVGVGLIFILPNLVWLLGKAGDTATIANLHQYPLQAIQWARAHPDQIGTHIYNSYGDGGFLVWQFPEQKVFIDGRMSYWQMGDKFVLRDARAIDVADPGAIQMMQDRYGVDWVLVNPHLKLAQALSQQPGWQLVYNDSIAVIYTKTK